MKNPNQEQKKVKIKRRDTCESAYALYEGRELTLNFCQRWNIFSENNTRKKSNNINY